MAFQSQITGATLLLTDLLFELVRCQNSQNYNSRSLLPAPQRSVTWLTGAKNNRRENRRIYGKMLGKGLESSHHTSSNLPNVFQKTIPLPPKKFVFGVFVTEL